MNNMPEDTFDFSLTMVDALWGLDPDSDEMWRARLRWARRQSPRVAGFLQFAHVLVNHLVEERRTFDLPPFSPLPERTRRVRRKILGQYVVRVRIVGPSTADAPGWCKKVVRG